MATLKDKINRILGNNVRLLLPSYWWKRAFGLISDEVETLKKIQNDTGNSLTKTTKRVSNIEKEIPKKYIIYDSESKKEDNIIVYESLKGLSYSELNNIEIYFYKNGNYIKLVVGNLNPSSDFIDLGSYIYGTNYYNDWYYCGMRFYSDGTTNDWFQEYSTHGIRDVDDSTSYGTSLIIEDDILNILKFNIDLNSQYSKVSSALMKIVSNIIWSHYPAKYALNFRVENKGYGYYIIKEDSNGPITLYWKDNYGGIWESTIEKDDTWTHKTNYGGVITFGNTLDEESIAQNIAFLKDNTPNIGTLLQSVEDGTMYKLLSYKDAGEGVWDLYISRNGITEYWTVNTTDGTTSFVGDIGVTKEELNEAVTAVLNTEV